MKAKLPLFFQIGTLAVALAITVGCTKAPNDAQVTSDIQSKIGADSGLQNKQLTVQTEKGTVTLSGAVDNDAERDAAAKYAASEPGVKQVINNLQVAPALAAAYPAPAQSPATPAEPAAQPKPSPSARSRHHKAETHDQMAQSAPPQQPASAASSQMAAPAAPASAPPP